jgi:acetoin utilization deacetylase AcuC-like enzyme
MVLSLIRSYGLMAKLKMLPARMASHDELNSFHSSDYLEHCVKVSQSDDLDKAASDCDAYGLGKCYSIIFNFLMGVLVFAYWAIVSLGSSFFEKILSNPKFSATFFNCKSYVNIYTKKGWAVGLHFGIF